MSSVNSNIFHNYSSLKEINYINTTEIFFVSLPISFLTLSPEFILKMVCVLLVYAFRFLLNMYIPISTIMVLFCV